MKLLKLGLIAALSCLTLQAHASNWVYVSTNVSGSIWYLDTTSFRYANNRPKDVWFWVQVQYLPTSKMLQKNKVATSKIRYHVSCVSRMQTDLDMVFYDTENNLLSNSQGRGDYDFNMKSIIPDTIMDVVATYACTQAFSGVIQ